MLKLDNISYEINGKVILKNINFEFERGKIFAITGVNGSGKSTLIKIVMGILKQTSGHIFFDGVCIDNLSICQRSALGFSFAFQQPIRFKGISVLELFGVAAKTKDFKKSFAVACENLSKVGLCAKNYVSRELDSTLSGGEMKRIELAVSLAEKKQVVFFDEPEAGIDIWSFSALSKLFAMQKNTHSLTIIVSHQQKILEVCDEIIVLENGGCERKDISFFHAANCAFLKEGENE